jgi:hypothetical protein
MKRINRKEYARFLALSNRLSTEVSDPARMSTHLWRGDVRAIQWAAWWIRETVEEEESRRVAAHQLKAESR